MITIRQYQDEDRDAVWALHNSALVSAGAHAGNGPWDDDLRHIQDVYLKTGGEFLVGLLGSEIVAMGALKRLSADRAEVKRVRVRPEHQRKGFGQAILKGLERRASELGFKHLCVDTTTKQKAAQALYKKSGYRETGRKRMGLFSVILFEKGRGKSTPAKQMPEKPTPAKPSPAKSIPAKPLSAKPMPEKPVPEKPVPEKPVPEKPREPLPAKSLSAPRAIGNVAPATETKPRAKKTYYVAASLAVGACVLLAFAVVRYGSGFKHDGDVLRVTGQLADAKATLEARNREVERLNRQLRDAYFKMRASSKNDQFDETLANAIAENYQMAAESARNSGKKPVKHSLAEFLKTHGLTDDLPEEDRAALLAIAGDQRNPNMKVALASFQDPTNALRTLLASTEQDPENLPAWAALARQALLDPKADASLRKAVSEMAALDPNNAYAHCLEAISSWKAGKLTEAYAAIEEASRCDRYDDYRLDQVAYRDALLQEAGYSDGLAKHLAIQGMVSQPALTDQKGLATSLVDFADAMKAQGKPELAVPAYQAVSQYASRLVGHSWNLVDELSSLDIKKSALQGLLQAQNASGATGAALTEFSLKETEDRAAKLEDIIGRISQNTEAFTKTMIESDTSLANYYNDVLKYGEAKVAASVLKTNASP